MKKFIILLLLTLVTIVWSVTETHTGSGTLLEKNGSYALKKCTVEFGDVNDSTYTEPLEIIYGYLEAVVIDANGTDTSYKVYVKDENGITLFTKEDCNTVDGDYRYVLSSSDTGSTEFMGIPVGGSCSVIVDDANDLDDIYVILYYQRWWQ